MNTPLRSKQTQALVKKSLRAAISTTTKTEQAKVLGSLVSWNGNAQTAVGSHSNTARHKASVANKTTTTATTTSPPPIVSSQEEDFPMKLAHFIQRRQEQQDSHTFSASSSTRSSPLQEKWAKLANLTMDPGITQVSETIANRQPLPQCLTSAMADSRPCFIASLEDPFTIVNVNPAWCLAYGYTKDEVLNQNVVKLLGHSQALEDFVLEQLLLLPSIQNHYSHNGQGDASFTPPILHYAQDGTPMEESLRVGSLSIGADVSDRYLVCVTEMETDLLGHNDTSPNMITSLDQTWGPMAFN